MRAHVTQRGAQNSEEHEVTVAYILSEVCADEPHYIVIVAPEHSGFTHPLARRRQRRVHEDPVRLARGSAVLGSVAD